MVVRMLILCLWLCSTATVLAQQTVVYTGTITDIASGEAIVGASLRVDGTTRGTYSKQRGEFRLPLAEGRHAITVRSIGYAEQKFTLDPTQTTVRIQLKAAITTGRAVTVVADMTAEEIIARAIARKKENAARIRSSVTTLYTKTRIDVDASGAAAPEIEEAENSILENFSRVYERRMPLPATKHVEILQRRQTRNVPALMNMAVFDDFFDFTDNELKIINTTLVTPLADDALGEYRYTLKRRTSLGDKMVYEIAFEPSSRLFPGFEGTLTIIEGTYQVVAASFAPTEQSAFFALKNLTYEQRFEQYNDSIWTPMYQQVTARVALNIVTGLLGVGAKVTAQTHVTDVAVNIAIPDSLLDPKTASRTSTNVSSSSGSVSLQVSRQGPSITVAPDADSAKSDFWEQHAFAEPSEEERNIYRKMDSIVPIKQKERAEAAQSPVAASGVSAGLFTLFRLPPLALGVTPTVDVNALTGFTPGAQLTLVAPRTQIVAGAGFGEQSTRVGSVEGIFRIVADSAVQFDMLASVFSSAATIQSSRAFSERFSFVNITNILFGGYYDYYRREGYDVGARLSYGKAALSALYTEARYRAQPLVNPPDRTSISPADGAFRTMQATLSVGERQGLETLLGSGWPVYGSINTMVAMDVARNKQFASVNGHIGATIHTFATGYDPMSLEVTVLGGIQDAGMPRQFQFGLLRRFPIFGARTDFATVPINAYGGTSYAAVVAEHNLTDIWWRLIGLPTYNGRGLDLIVRGSSATLDQRNVPVIPGSVYDGTRGWYSEAGFALARIPSFLSDFVFLRVDAMWPVGNIAAPRGTFGWAVTLSSPF